MISIANYLCGQTHSPGRTLPPQFLHTSRRPTSLVHLLTVSIIHQLHSCHHPARIHALFNGDLPGVIRAKGGRRESEFVARFDAHPRLGAAIAALAHAQSASARRLDSPEHRDEHRGAGASHPDQGTERGG